MYEPNISQVACRLCLKYASREKCFPIFSNFKEDIDLSEKIFSCVSLKIHKDDGLPVNICEVCYTRLHQSFNFRQQCLVTDEVLRKTLKQKDCSWTVLEYQQAAVEIKKEINSSPKQDKNFEVHEAKSKDFPKVECAIQEFPETMEPNIGQGSIKRSIHLPLALTKIKRTKEFNLSEKENDAKDSHEEYLFFDRKKKTCTSLDCNELVKSGSKRKLGEKKQNDFKCTFCGKIYPSEGGWRYHVHTVHSQSFQPFICDLCGKSFKAKKNMEGHKNAIHFHLKQHLCDLCGRGFASKYALKVHKIWHTGERNFSCEICGSKFRTKSKLNSHRAVHGGPKNFICEVCSRDFRRKKDFEIHLRSHTGEKPYSCQVCEKAFSSLTNKKKHEKNHMLVKVQTSSNSSKSGNIASVPCESLSGG